VSVLGFGPSIGAGWLDVPAEATAGAQGEALFADSDHERSYTRTLPHYSATDGRDRAWIARTESRFFGLA